ncbi:E3 ubiquitin-protein ligase WAV3 isoform X2 [Abrus precatorius]|uniref:RING-type E3 ubiquitin transferase n=1 Tax=Abrus precatorius TaxID=3816 RepID=A0A8B8LKN3_ABRPR|nr:E3 ubiquitin-protein ligase WAV3 isoform X2 [Abrus precatorius]
MGTGWRRAFCTRDPESTISDKQPRTPSPTPSPRTCVRLGFLSGGGSNPPTPSLRCRTIAEAASQSQTVAVNDSPRVNTKTTPRASKSPKILSASNPTSPRSPLKLSLFKNSFKFRSSCGICLSSVKTGQGTAIYTAECAHAFHFPCIAAHVRKHGSLVCPVCNATWKDVPLLAAHKNLGPEFATHHDLDNPSPVVKTKHVEPPQQPPKHSDSIRSYDDDEPLLSPTSGGRIIPIPEADENAEDDDDDDAGEFQGFFVNPKHSSSSKSYSDASQSNDGDSRTVQVKLMPECAVISASRMHDTYALVLKVKAPPPPPPPRSSAAAPLLDPSQRAPIDLVTVLDVGGSMSGAKLHMLKRAMRLVISSLGPADRLSIVAFSASPKRLMPLRRMTAQGQRMARRIVDRLVTGQGSSVGEALRKATRVLEDRRERNPVASVMLLSDGQEERVQSSNKGNQRNSASHVSSTRFAHIEIPVHAFGFGTKSGYSHEPGEDAFAKCVGGLLSVVVQDLRIQLGFQSDSAPIEISAIYSCSGRPTLLSSGAVRLGDLYAEEDRELLVELRVPASALAIGTHHVMTVRCLYKDPASQEIVYGREQGLVVPPPQSVRCSATRIQSLRNLFITTRAIAESRRLLDHNADFTSAHHLLASARALLMQSSSASAEDYVRGLEAELAELHWRRQHEQAHVQQQQQIMVMQQRRRGSEREVALVDENGEPLTPTSAWRAAEKLAKMAMMKKSLNRVSDLHGFENARF